MKQKSMNQLMVKFWKDYLNSFKSKEAKKEALLLLRKEIERLKYEVGTPMWESTRD